MTEAYRPVVGYEGLYEVSNQGRVRSLPRPGKQRPWRTYGGKLLTATIDHYYFVVGLQGSSRTVHSLVAEAFLGPRPDGMVVRHGPNGPLDNSVENLSYGTQRQNIHDKKRDGTWQVADTAARRILTSDQVKVIYQSTEQSPALAEHYGVHQTTIRKIWMRRNWGSVTCHLPDRPIRSDGCQK